MFFDRKRVHIDNQNAADILQRFILSLMGSLDYSYERDLIILCVGTDRSTGDSLAPSPVPCWKKTISFLPGSSAMSMNRYMPVTWRKI